jgi:hypothetical protein
MPTQTYMPALPEIAKAYQNDPRTQLAIQAMTQGSSVAPVAGGKYAWADGIARALQGGLGGFMQKRQMQKYDQREQDVMAKVAAALAGGGAGAPPQGVPQQGAGGAPAAMGQPPQAASVPPPPPQNMAAPQMAPQAPPQAAQQPPQAPQAPPAPMPPQVAPGPQGGFDALGGQGGAPMAPVPGKNYSVADAVAELHMSPEAAQAQFGGGQGAVHSAVAQALAGGGGNPAAPFTGSGVQLINAMLPITRTTESNNRDFKADGSPVTSSEGAKFAMQVMPATARKPGFGIAPARDNSAEEYNRVGTELLQKLTEKYGDPAKAWAAYNAGSGRLEHAMEKHGDNWLAAMPSETQKYVAKNMAALGGQAGGNVQQAAADGPMPAAALAAQNTSTPVPELPGLPQRPADRPAAQSLRLDAGRKLIATKDPFLYQQAMQMLDAGMGEQLNADQKALDELNGRDDTLYQAGINDHYNAANQQRGDAYAARSDERGFVHADRTLAAQQQFQHDERLGGQQFESGENALNRTAQKELTQMTIDGRKDVASVKAQRLQNFLQTPQGAKMYTQTTDAMQKNDNIIASVDAFMKKNEQQETGGMVLNTGAGNWLGRSMNSNLQEMDSLVHNLAPQLRQAGQGSMSDRDLQLFEQSIPNIGMSYKANVARAGQIRAFVGRMNDFETHKLQAASDGTGVNFLKDWSAYRQSVPVLGKDGTPNISFDEWQQSLPRYDAKGNKL